MITDCTAVIMAGGESRRMGSDKASLMLGEKNLLQHVADIVRLLFPKTLASVRQLSSEVDLPQVCDTVADAGPLAGLYAALEHAGTPWIFVVATDMPFIEPLLIERLAQKRNGYQAVVPVVDGFPQPLAAFYATTCLPAIRAALEGGGQRSLRTLLGQLKVCHVDEVELRVADPGLRSFFDLDTPQDLLVAKRIREQ